MGSLSNFAALALLDHVFNVAYSPAATIYLALCTADPTDAGTGASMNECADANGYTRKAITLGAANSRRVTQSGAVTFDQASGAWSTVTHWAYVDSGTHGAGNMLAHGQFGVSKSVVNGNTPSVASGETYAEITGEISTYLAGKLLDLMFRNQAYSKPDTYVALVTAAVDESKTGSTITEPAGGDYGRKQVNINGGASPTWDLAALGVVDNTHVITFVTATGSWGTITGVCIVDAGSAGNLLFYDNAMDDQAVGAADIVTFPAGNLDNSLS